VGEYAYLKVGSFYFSHFKYSLPFPWMVVFDSSKDLVLRTTVKTAKKKLRNADIKLNDVEALISPVLYVDIDSLRTRRKEILDNLQSEYYHVKPRMEELLGQALEDEKEEDEKEEDEKEEDEKEEDEKEEDEEIEHENLILQDTSYALEVENGMPEVSALYQMLLALQYSAPSEDIILDIHELVYTEDEGSDINSNVLEDAQELFIARYSALQYLYLRLAVNKSERDEVYKNIQSLGEDAFRDLIVIPLLERLGFSNVRKNEYHGQDEKGIDTYPFHKRNEFNQLEYFGAQVKAVRIHTDSRKSDGYAEGVLGQLRDALRSEFLLPDGNRIYLSQVFLITSKDLTEKARRFIHENLERVNIIDGYTISELIVKHKIRFY
jgi:hypothetical protein